MAWDSAILSFSRSFPNRDGICDLTPRVFEDPRVLRAAHAALGSQVAHELFFQYSPRLDEEAAVNGLVGHAHPFIFRILGLQPPGNLLGRPFQDQFTRNDLSQPSAQGKKALLGPQGRLPGLVIRLMCSIGGAATMACDFPAHRRSCSIQMSGYLTNR